MKRIIVIKGGPGSGHHGHSGRPGKRGGSTPSGGGGGGSSEVTSNELLTAIRDDVARSNKGYTSKPRETKDAYVLTLGKSRYTTIVRHLENAGYKRGSINEWDPDTGTMLDVITETYTHASRPPAEIISNADSSVLTVSIAKN